MSIRERTEDGRRHESREWTHRSPLIAEEIARLTPRAAAGATLAPSEGVRQRSWGERITRGGERIVGRAKEEGLSCTDPCGGLVLRLFQALAVELFPDAPALRSEVRGTRMGGSALAP
jgi:hypothetical protein